MSKKTIKLTHYEGFNKPKGQDKWNKLGDFTTYEEAKIAGALKVRPRYS